MKRILSTFVILLCISLCNLWAQNQFIPQDTTINIRSEIEIDTLLAGKQIFLLLNESSPGGGTAVIRQSGTLRYALLNHIDTNSERKISGYRIRIYFDNSQNARVRSEAIANQFVKEFPHIRVYLSHVNPYFKVTVGDFRTKYEAQRFAAQISGRYPSVFVVREQIGYPNVSTSDISL
ncbi:MAG TPA: SPOR domain-containing protein [Bacteroidales bacterium]|nr:SPOR domain-containing protein [Bacteroidales bacterium]